MALKTIFKKIILWWFIVAVIQVGVLLFVGHYFPDVYSHICINYPYVITLMGAPPIAFLLCFVVWVFVMCTWAEVEFIIQYPSAIFTIIGLMVLICILAIFG